MVDKLYQTLGLTSSASIDEVKKAYRNLAKEYHPDKNENGAEKFKEISHAYSILTDSEKKRDYILKQQQEHGQERSSSSSYSYNRSGAEGFPFYSPFDFFTSYESYQQPPNYNTRSSCSVTLEDVYNGSTVKMSYMDAFECSACHGDNKSSKLKRTKTCENCNGQGTIPGRTVNRKMSVPTRCVYCKGKGDIRYFVRCKTCNGQKTVRRDVNVKVPKGLHDGHSLQVKERGKLKPDGKSRGNVIFKVKVAPHKVFKRQGDHLNITVKITLKEAIMGFKNKKLCTHLDGRILTATQSCGNVIKPDTQRLIKGEGMPIFNSDTDARGDLLVTFQVEFPDTIQVPKTRTAKAAIDDLFETEQEKKAKENAIVIDDEEEEEEEEEKSAEPLQVPTPTSSGNTDAPITIDDDIDDTPLAPTEGEEKEQEEPPVSDKILEEVPMDYQQPDESDDALEQDGFHSEEMDELNEDDEDEEEILSSRGFPNFFSMFF
ncbi:MAG: hypothetical protein EXX96DRAFT_621516 [Benjaminiella poitrasii]|nr:MAG: hypothetical protein EXX96DRAFT_621516 [Benjaminiella poitrasii]